MTHPLIKSMNDVQFKEMTGEPTYLFSLARGHEADTNYWQHKWNLNISLAAWFRAKSMFREEADCLDRCWLVAPNVPGLESALHL